MVKKYIEHYNDEDNDDNINITENTFDKKDNSICCH